MKEAAYKALVRPHVEYASLVWDPHLNKHVKQIEGYKEEPHASLKNLYAGTRNSYEPTERVTPTGYRERYEEQSRG